jgi:hypothetical protein
MNTTATTNMRPDDIRVTHLDEIILALRKYACAHRAELFQMDIEQDDFVQDCIRNIFARKGFDKYDPDKCHGVLEGLVFNCAKRHMIDMKRRAYGSRLAPNGKPYVKVSLETPLSEDGSLTVEDTLVAKEDPSIYMQLFVEAVPESVIGDGVSLTWRALFNLSVNNTQKEISELTGLKVRHIRELQQEMKFEYLLPAIANANV